MSNLESNPFSALFSNPPEETTAESNPSVCEDIDMTSEDSDLKDAKIDSIVQMAFYITINKFETNKKDESSNDVLYLEDLSNAVAPRIKIDVDTLEQALFERLLLPDPSKCLLSGKRGKCNKKVVEKEVITYLFTAEQNLSTNFFSNDKYEINAVKQMKKLIIRNAVTALKQPDLFADQNLTEQIMNILKSHDSLCQNFLYDIVNEIVAEDGACAMVQLRIIFLPILKLIHNDISKASLVNLDVYVFPVLHLFVGNAYLLELFLESCQPSNPDVGVDYQKTILGELLSLSTLPKNQMSQFEYFLSPLDPSASTMEEQNLYDALERLVSNLHKIFLSLLKSNPKVKKETLKWISNCIHANLSKGKIWSSQNISNSSSGLTVSDGFMLNLGYVLAILCQPFCFTSNNTKYLKIDPTYCAVEEADRESKHVSMREMSKETCIIPPREVYEDIEGPTRPTVGSYNFVTECFFMAHKALDLGYRVVAENLTKISQELGHARQTIAEALANATSELASMLDNRIKRLMTRLLSMRCALREPRCLMVLSNLHSTSCNWLVQVALHKSEHNTDLDTYAPLTHIELKFPLDNEEIDTLRCVPEFVVENVVVFLNTVKYCSSSTFVNQGMELLQPILSLVLVFMGSTQKMRNPHLRARLAECLATLLPDQNDDSSPANLMSSFFRGKLFNEHPHRLQIVPNLLEVFVGIEVTGQSVQFEQKFNYRRPMYLIMEYLWEIEEHRNIFKKLSKEAEANMESVTPPIFLRFVNLLMNDAVFLLDEALNNMAQIRTMQLRSESNIASLPIREREEHYHNLRYTSMIARFDNILGKHTILALEHLTSEIKSVFCHPTMVDRIASMLNYFLSHLTGPNQKNFKVKDPKEYEFDPVNTVLNICRIYIHLGDNDDFCLAVSQDGRSYSPKLFKSAEDVLVRIHGVELISSLQTVAQRVSDLAQRQLQDEEILADVPEEYLDPIMSTIMYDPVILPSSKKTIDRTTIARHLLSDQSDPFNRSPLSMDQIKPDVELKKTIHEWVEQKRKNMKK